VRLQPFCNHATGIADIRAFEGEYGVFPVAIRATECAMEDCSKGDFYAFSLLASLPILTSTSLQLLRVGHVLPSVIE
jgi:hypothetical protein